MARRARERGADPKSKFTFTHALLQCIRTLEPILHLPEHRTCLMGRVRGELRSIYQKSGPTNETKSFDGSFGLLSLSGVFAQ